MSRRSDIRSILAAGPRSAEQIAELCEGRKSYGIADWPAAASASATAGDAPPPRAASGGKRGKRGARARAAELPAAPARVRGRGVDTHQPTVYKVNSSGFHQMHPFLRALQLVEPSSMARALGVSLQMISKMKKAAEADATYQVPATHLRAIQTATAGKVTIEQLVIARPAATDQQRAAA